MWQTLISNLIDFFQDNDGNNSSMRLFVFMVVAVILFNWTWINIKTGTLTPLSLGEWGTIVGSLIAKYLQKGKEEGT